MISKESAKPLRLLRLPEVMERVGLRHTAIYGRMARGQFPKPVRIGLRAVAWPESDIDRFVEARIAARDDGSLDTEFEGE